MKKFYFTFLAVATAFLVMGVHQLMTVGLLANYFFFMTSAILLLLAQYYKKRNEEKK